MMTFIQRHQSKIAQVARGFLFLTVLTPLLYLPDSFVFPFVTPKALWVRGLVTLALGLYSLLLLVDYKKYRPKAQTLLFMQILFLAWAVVSSVIGADPHNSFFGDHERMFGLITVVQYVALFALMLALFERKHWRAYFTAITSVGIITVLLGLWQVGNPDFLAGGDRVASTLGNPLYVGALGGHLLFFALLWAHQHIGDRVSLSKRSIVLAVGAASALLGVVGIFISQTRGAVVGLGAAILSFLFLFAVLAKKRAHQWIAAGVVLMMLFATIVTVLSAQSGKEFTNPALSRFADFSITGSAEARLRTWGVALDAWKQRPMFGWGWFNFGNAYDMHFNPKQLKHGFGETHFDQAHNQYLEVLTTTGSVGLVLYLGLWFSALLLLWRAYRAQHMSMIEVVLIASLMVFHLVQIGFGFENITSMLWITALLAYVAHKTAKVDADYVYLKKIDAKISIQGRKRLAWGVVVVAVLALYYGTVIPTRAIALEYNAREALLARGNVGLWFANYSKAMELPDVHKDDIRRSFVEPIVNLDVGSNTNEAALHDMLLFSTQQLQINTVLHPRSARAWMNYGAHLMLLDFYFGEELPEVGAQGVRAFEKALEYSPDRQQLHLLYADALAKTNSFQQTRPSLDTIRSLAPAVGLTHSSLAPFYERVGDIPAAIAAYEQAIKLDGAPFVFSTELQKYEAFGLMHLQSGNPVRGAWFVDSSMACKDAQIDWVACPWFIYNDDGELGPRADAYKPRPIAFTVMIDYYQRNGNQQRAAIYQSVASDFFPRQFEEL